MGRMISIKIHYSHRSILVGLLALVFMVLTMSSYLTWGEGEVTASAPQAPMAAFVSVRQYYLTKNFYNGGAALSACQEGYHMASLWEIIDPSNLKYNSDLGYTQADSGQGPPANVQGWVRTGYNGDTSTTPGQGNCNVWDSDSSSHQGTQTHLPANWDGEYDTYVWEVGTAGCNSSPRVWCVANNVGSYIYLPVILRNH